MKERQKDPNAVALGRKGGLRGGVARAKNLSKEELSAIGSLGAAARIARYPDWKKYLAENRKKPPGPKPGSKRKNSKSIDVTT